MVVAVAVSAGFFALAHPILRDAGYSSMSVGPFALALGLIVGAVGIGWVRKALFAGALALVFTLMAVGGSMVWFGAFRFGDLSTAPSTLSAATMLPFLIYAMFAFLPWAVPIVVLVWCLGGDPRTLWSRQSR